MDLNPDYWRKCSSCKKPIAYLARYHICTVSTCNKKRGGFVFCSVSCWDAHVPTMNHRNAWSEERRAPSLEQAAKELAGISTPTPPARPSSPPPPPARAPSTFVTQASQRAQAHSSQSFSSAARLDPVANPAQAPVASPAALSRARSEPESAGGDDENADAGGSEDVLVVASRLKSYIRNKSGFSTSAAVLDALSEHIRVLADAAIEQARAAGRKTVLDRDVPRP